MSDRGFAWDVYPRDSSRPMVAAGLASDGGKARAAVELVLRDEEDAAAWGLMISPSGETDVCRRGRDGKLIWRPLFPEMWPVLT